MYSIDATLYYAFSFTGFFISVSVTVPIALTRYSLSPREIPSTTVEKTNYCNISNSPNKSYLRMERYLGSQFEDTALHGGEGMEAVVWGSWARFLCCQKAEWWILELSSCRSLKENGPHSVIYLNTWFSVGGMAWEGVGGVSLRAGLEVSKCVIPSVSFSASYLQIFGSVW